MAFRTIPFDPTDPQPTVKNTPANTAAGMVCSTINNGPVMVPIIPRPMTKCETRCSTTATGLVIERRISAPSPSAVAIRSRSVS